MKTRVVTANNGKQAVDTFCSLGKKFDAILINYFMPEMNGIQTTTLIRDFEN